MSKNLLLDKGDVLNPKLAMIELLLWSVILIVVVTGIGLKLTIKESSKACCSAQECKAQHHHEVPK